MNGFLLVDKPAGMTSHDVVAKVRKLLKTKRVGHHGTLDPLATGLLVLGVNDGCKALKFINEADKTYTVTMRFGSSFDTLDCTGKLLSVKSFDNDISKVDIVSYFNSIIGVQEQQVPLFSAVKINGKKLYEYARQGISVTRPFKTVTIKELAVINFIDDILSFKVTATKGFYVRVLCEDIGKHFNYPSHMVELRRDAADDFSLKTAYTLEQIEKQEYKIISLNEFAREHFDIVQINQIEMQSILQGKPYHFKLGKNAYFINDELVAIDERNITESKTLRLRKE